MTAKQTTKKFKNMAQVENKANKKQAAKRPPARVIHQFREPVTRVTTKTKYMDTKRYTDKFGAAIRALTTAHNKHHQILLQLLKLNRVVGIHLDLTDTTGNENSKYNTLYNDLFALEIEIEELNASISELGKVTDILEPGKSYQP
jgi:hypothetical protein